MSNSPKIGLALGGGAARGFAHVPMLEAFDELGLKPAVIAGCSIGAVVAAAYACGMTGREIRDHVEATLSGRMDFARYIFRSRQTKLSQLLSLKSLLSLHLQGEKLADLALPDHLVQNIEDTAIPLKIIATDYERMEEVVLQQGSIIKAVGASIAIPGLIAAPRLNGRVHVDGGVVNPVPFDHVREGMDIVVAIDVTGKPRPIGPAPASNLELAIGSLLIMFNQLAERRRMVNPPDIYVKPSSGQFGATEFFRAKEIMQAASGAKNQFKRELEKKLTEVK